MDRACFDYMIIEDSSNVPYTYQGSHNSTCSTRRARPSSIRPCWCRYLAMATKTVGIVPTLSVSEYPPYLLARLVNSLDHTTEGRIGWNCVTGSNDGAAQNYGHEKHRPHDERYDVADEFADVVTEAVGGVGTRCGRARPREADVSPTARRSIPSTTKASTSVPRADQRAALAAGGVPICQAGGSPRGQQFAVALGRHHHHRRRRQHRKHEGLSRQGAPAGRRVRPQSRRHQGAVPGPSDHRRQHGGARATADGWRRPRPRSISTCICRGMSRLTGIDFSKFDLDEPLPAHLTTNGHQSSLAERIGQDAALDPGRAIRARAASTSPARPTTSPA